MANNFDAEKLPAPLSAQEESRLFQLMKEGNSEAESELIEHNLRLVVLIAGRFCYRISGSNLLLQKEDLLQVGSHGLIKAVRTFTPENGCQFSYYAGKCIENEIRMLLRRLNKVKAEVSLDEANCEDKDGNTLSLIDFLSRGEDTEGEYLRRDSIEQVRRSLGILEPKERRIVELHFGFNGNCLTQLQMEKVFKSAQSHISKIERKALAKLARLLELQSQLEEADFNISREALRCMTPKELTFFCATAIVNTNIKISDLSMKFEKSQSEIIVALMTELPFLDGKLYKSVCAALSRKENQKYERIMAEFWGEKNDTSCFMNCSEESSKNQSTADINIAEKLVELISQKSKEDIEAIILDFDYHEQRVIHLGFSSNFNIEEIIKAIANEYNVSIYLASTKVREVFKKFRISLGGGVIKKEQLSRNEMGERTATFDFFPCHSKEQVLEAIEKLTPEERELIELRLGLNGNKITSVKDIAKLLNINYDSARRRIYKILAKIKGILEIEIALLKLFLSLKEEKLESAKENFNPFEIEIILLYRDLDFDRNKLIRIICDKYYMDISSIDETIKIILEKIKIILNTNNPMEEKSEIVKKK